MRRILALVAASVALAAGLLIPATPAFAACGDSSGSWVPATGSTWYVEILLNDNTDLTAATAFTYPGQLAVTEITETLQTLEGQWDFAGGSDFIFSGTDIGDNSYRLTFTATANDCGALGGVHAAYGTVTHQTQGQIGVLYMTRIT